MVARTGTVGALWNRYTSPGVVVKTKAVAVPGSVSVVSSTVGGGTWNQKTVKWNIKPTKRIATETKSFGGRFWRDHWHLREVLNALGNVLTDQEITFYVHNAFRTSQNVVTINETGAEGITITDNGTPSFAVNAQTTLSYVATVDSEGPASINYIATFGFAAGSLLTQITGLRIVVFPFAARRNIVERWIWNTDIIPNADGTEQRNSVRDIPAQEWDIKILLGDEAKSSRAENMLYGWRPNKCALPIEVDDVALTSAVTIGQGNLPVSFTADTHFTDGVDAIIFDTEFNFEQVSVSLVGPTLLTIDANQPKNNWPLGTRVMPIHTVNMRAPSARLWPINAREYSFNFRNHVPVDVSDNSGFTMYKSKPVWTDDWLISNTYNREFPMTVLRSGAGIGPFFDDTLEEFPKVDSSMIIDLPDRAAFWNIKRFIHSLRGRQKTFWLPSNRPDFTLESDGSTVTINIEPAFYTTQIFGNALQVRRDIVVEFVDGTIEYREITNSTETPGVREVLTVAALSQSATIANVAKISYLYRMRLASDTVEFVHEFANDGEVIIGVKEVGA